MEIKNTTPFHIIIALCFAAVTVLCMTGHWFPCFYLATLIITLYMALGSIKQGKIDLVFLCLPLGGFFVLWIVGFTLAQKYAVLFDNRAPDFTILGLHPSFFWVALLCWVGAAAVLVLGFIKFRDRWMSQEEWDSFKAEMAAMNAQGELRNGEEQP